MPLVLCLGWKDDIWGTAFYRIDMSGRKNNHVFFGISVDELKDTWPLVHEAGGLKTGVSRRKSISRSSSTEFKAKLLKSIL